MIYYDRPDVEGPKLSTYEKCNIPASEVNGLNNVLCHALGAVGNVKKKRHLYMVGNTRVHVDNVDGLGDFMELEVIEICLIRMEAKIIYFTGYIK